MNRIDIEVVPKIRRGEAGTIVLNIPATNGIKTLTIDLPTGVICPSGSKIDLAPALKHIDIPIVVTQAAPEEFIVKFHLVEKNDQKRASENLAKEYLMKIAR
jgi:hypothetical protein